MGGELYPYSYGLHTKINHNNNNYVSYLSYKGGAYNRTVFLFTCRWRARTRWGGCRKNLKSRILKPGF